MARVYEWLDSLVCLVLSSVVLGGCAWLFDPQLWTMW